MIEPQLPVAVAGAVAILCFVLVVWLPVFERGRTMRRRLAGIGAGGGLASDLGGQRTRRGGALPSASGAASPRPEWLSRWIEAADVAAGPAEILAVMLTLGLAAAAAAMFLRVPLIAAGVLGGGSALAPLAWLRWRRHRRQQRFVEQLPAMVDLMASMVRGGNSFLQALEHVAAESPEPMAGALATVVREIGLGAPQEEALERLALRFPSDDLSLVVAAVNVHHQIGGALSRILDQIAETLRERVRLAGDIRALTSMQRYSAYILALLPVLVAVLLLLISPDYVLALFTSPELRIATAVAAIMAFSGFVVMRRIAAIDV